MVAEHPIAEDFVLLPIPFFARLAKICAEDLHYYPFPARREDLWGRLLGVPSGPADWGRLWARPAVGLH
jgi:hypothetical protein